MSCGEGWSAIRPPEPTLTATVQNDPQASLDLPVTGLNQLVDLAARRSPEDQKRLLLGVAGLYEASAATKAAPAALAQIFVALTRRAERDVREALSRRLANVEWAPAELVRMLASDEIEIARPVIASSPLLRDDDLLELLQTCSADHRIQIALRPNLGQAVAAAIVAASDPAAMTALAANRSAHLAEADFAGLIEHSRRVAALRAPLTRHAMLSESLAARLYQWVGEALREAISERFQLDPERLAAAVDDATAEAGGGVEQEDADARLAAKLKDAGQLRPATLIRALREKKLGLFKHALALLGEFEIAQVQHALNGESARPLFLACTAAGLDRAAFPAVLAEIRKLNRGFPMDPDGGAWRLAERSPEQARYEFRLIAAEIGAANV